MFSNLTGWHFLILLAIVLLIFGAAKLPALAKSLGQSSRILKQELRAGAEEDKTPAATVAEQPASPVETTPVAPTERVDTLHRV